MSNASEFIIENGFLTKYVGPGGDVVVQEGVSEIGVWQENHQTCQKAILYPTLK